MNVIRKKIEEKNLNLTQELKRVGKSNYVGRFNKLMERDDLYFSDLRLSIALMLSRIIGEPLEDLLQEYEKNHNYEKVKTFLTHFEKIKKKAKSNGNRGDKYGDYRLYSNLHMLDIKDVASKQLSPRFHSVEFENFEEEINAKFSEIEQKQEVGENLTDEEFKLLEAGKSDYLEEQLKEKFPAEYRWGLRLDEEGNAINLPDCSQEVIDACLSNNPPGSVYTPYLTNKVASRAPAMIEIKDNGIRKDIAVVYSIYNSSNQFMFTEVYRAFVIDTDEEKYIKYFKSYRNEPFNPRECNPYSQSQEITEGEFYEAFYKHLPKFKISR